MVIQQPVDHCGPLFNVFDIVERRGDVDPGALPTGHLIPDDLLAQRPFELVLLSVQRFEASKVDIRTDIVEGQLNSETAAGEGGGEDGPAYSRG